MLQDCGVCSLNSHHYFNTFLQQTMLLTNLCNLIIILDLRMQVKVDELKPYKAAQQCP